MNNVIFTFPNFMYFPRPTYYPALPVVTRTRGHVAGAPPLYGTCLGYHHGNNSTFYSRVDFASNFENSRSRFLLFFCTSKNPPWLESKA